VGYTLTCDCYPFFLYAGCSDYLLRFARHQGVFTLAFSRILYLISSLAPREKEGSNHRLINIPAGSLILSISALFFKEVAAIIILRIAAFLFFLCTAVLEAQALNVSVQAKYAILYNPDNGAILFQKNAHDPHYPASILKIATALFVLDHKKVDLNKKFIASKKALEVMDADIKQADPMKYPAYILEHDGVTMGLEEEKSYMLKDLLHGLLLASGNDAANVIAENCSRSIEKFMDELNGYLREKGIHQTCFQNPHGLHHPAQVTTAYDMACIAALAFRNPRFCEIVKVPSYELEIGGSLTNYNSLVKEGKYQYPKILGGKTGYVASSGFNLVAAAEDQGRTLIAVLLGYEKKEDRFKDAITLFETAFREKKKRRLLFSKDPECFFAKSS